MLVHIGVVFIFPSQKKFLLTTTQTHHGKVCCPRVQRGPKTGCEKHVAVEILASRSEFRSLQNVLENPTVYNLTNNIFAYVVNQGHVDPCEDFKPFKALLRDVVPDEEIAGYVAYINKEQ